MYGPATLQRMGKSDMTGPKTAFGDQLHAEKYRAAHESFRDYANRVASALSDDPDHFHRFRQMLLEQRYLPAGRIQSGVGSTKSVTPYNCYVSGTINDSFVHGEQNIMEMAKEAAATMRQGGGIGYDFSTLRPQNDLIKKLNSGASGPVSFMDIFDAVCRCIASAGHRRGAEMGVLRVDHPDVEEFIHAKQPDRSAQLLWDFVARHASAEEHMPLFNALQRTLRLTGFNVSLAITDEFMECLDKEEPFPLRFDGEIYRYVDPVRLWETVMRGTWDWAEPGVLFVDNINRLNNLWYCETIAATNPCGEQPLPPYGACLLGSVNLTKYVRREGSRYVFDWDALSDDVPHIVRAMDNVPDQARYPLEKQREEALNKRRMGIGITGLANAGEALGFPYGSPEFLEFQEHVERRLTRECYLASARLAQEKGAFPLYDERYLESEFVKSLDEDVQEAIARNGIRNSHLRSNAPTGTISLVADNVSSGIEPVVSKSYQRDVHFPEGKQTVDITDYGHREFGTEPRDLFQVTTQQHVEVLKVSSRNVDSAVSKTCNVPSDTPWQQFKDIYRQAHAAGAKGCTTFQWGGKRAGVLKVDSDDGHEEPEDDRASQCRLDPETGRSECE